MERRNKRKGKNHWKKKTGDWVKQKKEITGNERNRRKGQEIARRSKEKINRRTHENDLGKGEEKIEPNKIS